MATVFMKWLETKPEDYDRGIRLLTLGRLDELHVLLVSRLVEPGQHILEIGCGTGLLTAAMARQGATVVGIDINPGMLRRAESRLREGALMERVELHLMDAAQIGERFEDDSFDLVVSSLAFSEITPQARAYVLESCLPLMKPGARLAIIDEVQPERYLERLVISAVRMPLRLLTWLLTRATTHPLKGFDSLLAKVGFRKDAASARLLGSLRLVIAIPTEASEPARLPGNFMGRLAHRTTWGTVLIDLWTTFFRLLPPYPKIAPGLYAVGEPMSESPVLVTGNFDLTVRRLVKALDGRVDAWVLVVDSDGINVWCAAGGGFLTAERVIGALRTSRLEQVVEHRALILPQLCANGVDGWRIRSETRWGIHWGPVRAADIPAYLDGGRAKTDDMRYVDFPLKDRLEMMAATLGLYGLMILIPVAIIWPTSFWLVLISLIGLSTFYAVSLPWLPGRDGLAKSLPLALIALAAMLVYSWLWDPAALPDLFNRLIAIGALSVFVGAELQGMSPLMRGEQANWIWEAVIAALLLFLLWLVPALLGWR